MHIFTLLVPRKVRSVGDSFVEVVYYVTNINLVKNLNVQITAEKTSVRIVGGLKYVNIIDKGITVKIAVAVRYVNTIVEDLTVRIVVALKYVSITG